jgi:hypothetical protein
VLNQLLSFDSQKHLGSTKSGWEYKTLCHSLALHTCLYIDKNMNVDKNVDNTVKNRLQMKKLN